MNQSPEEFELLAYLDGELPSDRRRVIARALHEQPEVRDRLEHLRALRILSRQVIRDSTPRVSSELLAKVRAIAESEVPASVDSGVTATQITTVRRQAGSKRAIQWLPRYALAAAAMVCITLGSWLLYTRNAIEPEPDLPRNVVYGREASGLAVETVSLIEQRHLNCVTIGNYFVYPEFPRELKDVGPAVRTYLGDDAIIPDLSAAGLDFAGTGPCVLPGGKTLHWLFRTRGESPTFVSVFVQVYTGQVPFGTEKAVVVTGPTEKHPLLTWRSRKYVYYLIGDDFGAASTAAKRLGVSFGS